MVPKTYDFATGREGHGLWITSIALVSRLHGSWYEFACKLTCWIEKSTEYHGVWVIRTMYHEGVDCTG